MLTRIFRWLLSKCDPFHVGDGRGDTFFVRYKILKTRWGSVYLHEFFRSDKDRCLHDHPWNFSTLILRGGYWEWVRRNRGVIRSWRPAGWFARYPAEHAHRIELDPTHPRPWSLVFVSPKKRAWGFWGPDGWVAWSKDQPNPICETH